LARLAKTSPPAVRRAVARERLFARLDRSGKRIAWVSGPPGAGKTLLVATWIEARALDCVWYHVDAGDADLASFFYYLAEAAGGGGPRARKGGLPPLTPEYQGSEAAFARNFFRNLVSARRRPFVLVFDDVSEVARDAPVHLALREGLRELGEDGRAILVSREEPPPAYARLLASGTVDVVAAEELRLTDAEALAIAAAHAPKAAGTAALAHVCEVAGGWAAGVVLLASGAGLPDRAAPTHAALFDYLATEVFDHAGEQVKEILLRAAVSSPVPARLADRLCGADAARVLDRLASRAYFTTRRASSDPAFGLHPLLREFLLARLRERGEDALRRLRVRAAGILESEGVLEQALSLYYDAAAWVDVARLALAAAPSLLAAGRAKPLASWLGALPAEIVDEQPWVSYWLGRSRLATAPGEARALLDRAYRGFEDAGDVFGLYDAAVSALETILLEWADFREADDWTARIDALRARFPIPSRELELRLTAAMFGTTTFHRIDSPALLEWEERALALVADATTPAPLRLLLGNWVVVESTMRGEILRSGAVVEALAPLAGDARIDPLAVIGWLAGEAVHHWHSGGGGRAAAAVARGLAAAAASGVHVWDGILELQGANAALAEDDLERARVHLAAAEKTLDASRPVNAVVLEHERGLLALRAGDLDGAWRRASAVDASDAAGMPFARVIAPLMRALVATSRGDLAAARPELDRARRAGADLGSSLASFVCGLCEAELARVSGNRAAAGEHLRRAFAIARAKGVVPDAWFTRPQLARLCALALEESIEVEHVRALVRRLALEAPGDAAAPEEWPWPVRVRVLGELEVLKEDAPLRLRGRGPRRPADVLAAVVATGSPSAPEHAVEDALWPDSDGAHHALETALYRLRRVLGDGVLHLRDRTLSLDPRRAWVDALALEALLSRVHARLGRRDAAGGLAAAERAVRLYRGPFLAGRDDPWVLSARHRLRRRLERALADLASGGGEPGAVAELRARAAAADPALDASGPRA
jgi:ATP/maltotriose-dependent transcriptional regulator MalT